MEKKMSSENRERASKKSYQTPELTVHGSVEQLTELVDHKGDWGGNDHGGSCLKSFKRTL